MITKEMGYRSFLLRLWYFKQNGELAWRASLENPRTGQQQFFSTQEYLVEFLRKLGKEMESEMEKRDG
jgi:hypothetical protein